MQSFIVALILTVLTAGKAGGQVDLSSPDTAIKAFLEAVSARDFSKGAKCIAGAEQTPELEELSKITRGPFHHIGEDIFSCEIVEIKIDSEKAVVRVKVSIANRLNGKDVNPPFSGPVEAVTLVRDDRNWKIKPIEQGLLKDFIEHPAGGNPPSIISMFAAMHAYPAPFLAARSKAAEVSCKLRVKQATLFAMMYSMDHNGRLPGRGALQAALSPYYKKAVREEAGKHQERGPLLNAELEKGIVFHCPLDSITDAGYSLNVNLVGADTLDIDDLQTVLIYEGSNGKLDFRHDRKAWVSFLNGKVELIDSVKAKALHWQPSKAAKP